jgi:hypothetical protein
MSAEERDERPWRIGQRCDECKEHHDGPLLYIGSNRLVGGVFVCERCIRRAVEFFERCVMEEADDG